eukprot:5786072-Pyramimonas_sp.AAC.1
MQLKEQLVSSTANESFRSVKMMGVERSGVVSNSPFNHSSSTSTVRLHVAVPERGPGGGK